MVDFEAVSKLIVRINEVSEQPCVYISSAGGCIVPSWFCSIGGSSKSFIGSSCGYNCSLTDSFLGFTPSQYASAETSHDLAVAGLHYLKKSLPDTSQVFSIGVSSALSTVPPRRGSDRAFISLIKVPSHQILSATIQFPRQVVSESSESCRPQQFNTIGLICLNLIAEGLGISSNYHVIIPNDVEYSINRCSFPVQLFNKVVSLYSSCLFLYTPNGNQSLLFDSAQYFPSKFGILCGSFNPLHEGHVLLGKKVSELFDIPVFAELTFNNADKGLVSNCEISKRINQFSTTAQNSRDQSFSFSGVIVNCFSSFIEKILFFKSVISWENPVFILGYDTAIRLVDPKYYNNCINETQNVFDTFKLFNVKFYVAGRLVNDEFKSWSPSDYSHLSNVSDLFESLSDFRKDISSTELRRC
ncbi:hypothetical protein RCL1_005316 [Eukaryota sp. TZLM3-RCL]